MGLGVTSVDVMVAVATESAINSVRISAAW
jgi:hypothetical protein